MKAEFKKVPVWMQKVLYFTQIFPCADTRNEILNELISGEFDKAKFDQMCRDCHFAYNENGSQITGYENNHGAFFNQYEAIEAAGKNGIIKSLQGIIHEKFNNQ